MLSLSTACLPPPEPPGAADPPGMRAVQVRGVKLEGQRAALAAACVKRGLEQCFNATDDDCNGLVDEGCGIPDGDLALIAAWDDNPANLDWTLFMPNGKRLDKAHKQQGAFRYVKDCPEGCQGQNVEAIVADGALEPGSYRAELRLKSANGEVPVRVRVAARFGTRVEQGEAELTLDRDVVILTFQL